MRRSLLFTALLCAACGGAEADLATSESAVGYGLWFGAKTNIVASSGLRSQPQINLGFGFHKLIPENGFTMTRLGAPAGPHYSGAPLYYEAEVRPLNPYFYGDIHFVAPLVNGDGISMGGTQRSVWVVHDETGNFGPRDVVRCDAALSLEYRGNLLTEEPSAPGGMTTRPPQRLATGRLVPEQVWTFGCPTKS